MQEKKDIISGNIHRALGIHAPVVLLENDTDSHDLDEDDDFTLLPNGERQPENVYKVCQRILEDNEDHCGLLNFNVCLTQPDAKKQYGVADHKVLAKDCSKNSKSKVKQGLLNTLRGSTKNGKEMIINVESERIWRGSETKLLENGYRNYRWPSIKITVGTLLIWFCIVAWIAAVVLLKLTK